MRILLITGEFPPMQGGVGDYTRELARALADQGHEVFVLVSDSLADAYRHADSQPWHVLPLVSSWQWSCWRQVDQVLRQIQPDIIDIQYQAAVYDMRVPAINLLPWHLRWQGINLPVVVTFHDLKPPYLFPKAGPLRAWIVRWLARCSHAAILTNAEDMSTARAWPFARRPDEIRSVHLDKTILHQIPIGSNIAVAPPAGFDRMAWRAQFGYGPSDFVWAYFGFLNESKGGETLIRALAYAQHEDNNPHSASHKLLMIGGRVGSSDITNQEYAARIERLVAELGVGDHIQHTGYVPIQEVSAALLSVDAVVLPYRDGVSFRRGSLHAALVHGCAIVSTVPRVPLPELDNGANILLVPPEDPRTLCEAVLRLDHDPALRRRIGEGAKALARQFTWESIAQRTVTEVFRPLLATGPGPRAPSDNA